jgi:hypothetical protein
MQTTVDVFDVSTLPDGHSGVVPPEVASYGPLVIPVARFLDLHGRFDAVIAEINVLVGREHAAREADRRVLAESAAAGEDDPGTPATDALVAQIEGARRQAMGLSDALGVAQKNLIEAMRTHQDDWLIQLGSDANERRVRVRELVAELKDLLIAADSPQEAAGWYKRALDPMRTWGGVPHVNVSERPIHVAGASQLREHVLAGLIAAAE